MLPRLATSTVIVNQHRAPVERDEDVNGIRIGVQIVEAGDFSRHGIVRRLVLFILFKFTARRSLLGFSLCFFSGDDGVEFFQCVAKHIELRRIVGLYGRHNIGELFVEGIVLGQGRAALYSQ